MRYGRLCNTATLFNYGYLSMIQLNRRFFFLISREHADGERSFRSETYLETRRARGLFFRRPPLPRGLAPSAFAEKSLEKG